MTLNSIASRLALRVVGMYAGDSAQLAMSYSRSQRKCLDPEGAGTWVEPSAWKLQRPVQQSGDSLRRSEDAEGKRCCERYGCAKLQDESHHRYSKPMAPVSDSRYKQHAVRFQPSSYSNGERAPPVVQAYRMYHPYSIVCGSSSTLILV